MENARVHRRSPDCLNRDEIDGPFVAQEAVIVAFRKHTRLPLDDCLYALQATFPSSLARRCIAVLEGHGISRHQPSKETSPGGGSSTPIPIGFFHIDLAEVRNAEGKLYLFVAIDRASKFAVVELVPTTNSKRT